MQERRIDVVVVGAGHAGCEAARACARLGLRTAMITMNLDLIAQMSCNPAIGGIAKGHLVREIDALGGVMGEVTDAVGIQFRLLNTSRGPAVWSPRAQCDKKQVSGPDAGGAGERAESADHAGRSGGARLSQMAAAASDGRACCGMGGRSGAARSSLRPERFSTVWRMSASRQYSCGRNGEAPSNLLGDQLRTLGLAWTRLKTGTPPRLDGRTIDWSRFEPQHGDADPTPFRF